MILSGRCETVRRRKHRVRTLGIRESHVSGGQGEVGGHDGLYLRMEVFPRCIMGFVLSQISRSTHVVQHIPQRRLLKRIHTQAIILLHLNPGAHIFALVIFTCRQPLSRVAVALLTVASSTNGKELRAGQAVGLSTCCKTQQGERKYLLVGKLLAANIGPGPCARDPCFFLEWC
jgi:hypothetical protein